jgi:hypothetical protein
MGNRHAHASWGVRDLKLSTELPGQRADEGETETVLPWLTKVSSDAIV